MIESSEKAKECVFFFLLMIWGSFLRPEAGFAFCGKAHGGWDGVQAER